MQARRLLALVVMGDAPYSPPYCCLPALSDAETRTKKPDSTKASPITVNFQPGGYFGHATADYAWSSVLWLVPYVGCRARLVEWPSSLC